MIEVKCRQCRKIFKIYPSRIKIGKGKFCSKECSNEVTLFKKGSKVNLGKKNALGSKRTPEQLKNYGKTKGKPLLNMRGDKHWNWKGGESRGYKEGYYSLEYKKWRMGVFIRDNWTCQFCGIRGIYLTAHHIKSWAKYPKLRFDVDNGVTLCEDCHKLTDNYKGRNKKK